MSWKHGRWFRPRLASLKGTPYDSLTEQKLHEGVLKNLHHHQSKIDYIWPHTYTPDFTYQENGITIFIEVKGYFQDRDDASKYVHIRNSLIPTQELVFVFENPDKPMHFQSTRKDGTKMTHAEWAEKNGFRWFSEETIKGLIQSWN